MNLLPGLLDSTLAARLGWTLLHFLWQGAAIALLAALVLAALRRASASVRHWVACLALAAMAGAPVVTFVQLGAHDLLKPGMNWTADNVGQASRLPSATNGPVSEVTAASKGTGGTPVLRWLLPWLAVAWAIGVLVLAVRLVGGWWQTQRLRSRGTNPLGGPWPARLAALQRRLGVRRPVRLFESALARSPMVIGWLRPVILLPLGLASGLPLAQVEAILAHELAHLRRHDHLVNLAQRLVETALFYHPAVWWISTRIREERELCCDDLAAAALGDGATLAHALVSLAERQAALPEFAFAADGGPLGVRVRRLLGLATESPSMAWPRRIGWSLLLALLIGGGVWLWPQVTAPKLYQSVARLQLEPDPRPEEVQGERIADPNWLTTQVEMMQLNSTLTGVVERLGLNKRWAGQDGKALSVATARQRLRRHLAIRQLPNTTLVDICAASTEPKEASEIANMLADIYTQQRLDRRVFQAMSGFRMIKQEALSSEAELVSAKENLKRYRAEHGGSQAESSQEEVLLMQVERAKETYGFMLARMKDYDLRSKSTIGGLAVIVDPAEPAEQPTRWVASRRD